MINFQGLTLNGIYVGTRIQAGRPDANGQVRNTLFCGIQTVKQGAYGQESEVVEAVISDSLIKKGIAAKLQPLEGTELSIPVWSRLWSGQKGPGMTLYVGNDVEQLFSGK